MMENGGAARPGAVVDAYLALLRDGLGRRGGVRRAKGR
jgi:hypothetical protein